MSSPEGSPRQEHARVSPTLSRSVDPTDPQVIERQRTMDVDMAMQLSRARRETGMASPTSLEDHELDLDNDSLLTKRPSVLDLRGAHLDQAVDPSLLAGIASEESLQFPQIPQAASSSFSIQSPYNFASLDEFAAVERISHPASKSPPLFHSQDLPEPANTFTSARQRKSTPSDSTGRVPRKGIGGKLALFEGSNGPPPPSLPPHLGLSMSEGAERNPIIGVPNTGHDNRPYRFSFYSNALNSTIHARSLAELPTEGQTFEELFTGVSTRHGRQHSSSPALKLSNTIFNKRVSTATGPPSQSSEAEPNTWWLDITSPTDGEMKLLSKVFSIHPLTTEDIQMEEAREKIELFRNYYLVCFRSFDQDPYSPTHLEPLNMYIIVLREGILSFHFRPTPHPENVRRRIKQLKDYISVTSDWISYALIDDITDAFGPLIQNIEYEVDSIDELVLILKEAEQSDMLRRIGRCRKKVMGLLRLMGNKADVVKGLAKRCNENWQVAPTSDIGLYLSDIQDHLITMTQNLNHYEKILSRSHSNYLAQISIEMTDANNQINDVLSKLTALGTVLIPMNLVTGLWGMNVHVPGEGVSGYGWFASIIACLAAFAVIGGYSTYKLMSRRH